MHGIRDERNPMLSYLLFQQEIGQETDSDKLFLGEIYELALPAELVFLAACQTASGPISDGEGIISFSRALRYAGVVSTVAGLWNLPHQSTTLITTEFYSNLSVGLGRADALRGAKLEYLRAQNEPLLRHPYYWAGLILHGESGPVELNNKKSGNHFLYFGIAGLALLCIGIWTWRNR
jgi:CHAT domain-containing protein